MSKKNDSTVLACQSRELPGRFFAKYRDPHEPNPNKRWKKIPGGVLPAEFDNKDKVVAFAQQWFDAEMAARATAASEKSRTYSWAQLCDEFVVEVEARTRGAAATRHDDKKKARSLRTSAILSSRPVAEHDEALGLYWIRKTLAEPKCVGSGEPRDPLTVRNMVRVLEKIYKFARRIGAYPSDRLLPTDGEEFKAELAGALKEKAKLGKEGRVACPTETVRAIVQCEDVTESHRILRRTSFFTGIAGGELHGLRVGDYRRELGAQILDVRVQWTMPRKDLPSADAPLKTVWRKRKVPVHPSLKLHLDRWVKEGWKQHVGRAPRADDYLFPDSTGLPYREESAETFLADIRAAGCETTHKGVALDLYSLRHSFATIARRAGLPGEARDRLLGHRPKDMKAMFYEDDDLPVLAREVAKIPALLDEIPAQGESPAELPAPLANLPNLPVMVRDLVTGTMHASGAASVSLMISAEEERFELPVGANPRRFSKPLP